MSFNQVKMAAEVRMQKVLPVIIFCGAGLLGCVAFLVVTLVRFIKSRRKKEEFTLEDNVVTIKLKKR